MDVRYFELHDLLCDAIVALDSGNRSRTAAILQKALAWAEADWLATASELPIQSGPSQAILDEADDDDSS